STLTTKVTSKTGLTAADTFYFGNVVAETGDSPANTNVDLVDLGLIRANQTPRGTVGISSLYDLDRNGMVDLVDLALVRAYQTPRGSLPLITV
ncbi:MAG: hypothetical protein QM762_13040, partial [Chryseolinea sp.]